MSLPQPLMFTVGLIDQITKPIAKISQKLNGLASNYQTGTMQMATGVAGIAASGYALQNALMPAIEMDRALGEVSSLGVRDSALKMLANNSYDYALKYGESAVDFVRSSYDIQSAIAGLNDADLSRFTMASNVLAKATKADAATITNYMGTMYGIFSKDAERMGQGKWVQRLTGMTATAVQDFKTDGKKMSDAFAALGASAGLAPLEEQMAIMGKLQATMQGSESATKYKAFLAGVGKAQQALNLQFADANGNMLPMIDILNKIKGKYGETISVAESDQLAKAFGSQEAVSLVKLLLNDVDGLSNAINKLGKVNGMEQAEKMAAAMTDQSQRLSQSWFVIRAAFGSAVLPAFNAFVGKLADAGKGVIEFTQKFPNITRWLGYLGIGMLLAVAAGGLFTVMMGAGKMAMVTWAAGAAIWEGAIWLVNAGLKQLRVVMLAVNLAMYANPVGLIVAGIAALIAIVGGAIYYFDDLRNMLKGTTWGAPIVAAVDAIAEVLKVLGKVAVAAFSMFFDAVKMVWNAIQPLVSFWLSAIVIAIKFIGNVASAVFTVFAYQLNMVATVVKVVAEAIYNFLAWGFNKAASAWQSAVEVFSSFEWVKNLIGAASSIGEFMSQLWQGIKAKFAAVWGWIVEKLNTLPGVNIALDPVMNATKLTASLPNQQAVPGWMQRQPANDAASYVYALPQAQESITQQVNIKPVTSDTLANTITPKLNQQAAAAAQANRKANQTVNSGKNVSFGDVIVQNPPKNWSLAELADQQELLTA